LLGTPALIPEGEVFYDSDGKKIKGGKGARVRVDATAASAGKYVLSCTVLATQVGYPGSDKLEGGGILVVE
jgi:hypothetical protein